MVIAAGLVEVRVVVVAVVVLAAASIIIIIWAFLCKSTVALSKK